MKHGFRMTMIALLAFALTGCVVGEYDIDVPGPDDGREATLAVKVPGMRTPSMRALDAAKEKVIEEVNVVIISTDNNILLEHYRIDGSEITAAGGANDWTFNVKGVVNTSGITIAVIANASVEVAKALEAMNGGVTWRGAAKADFLAALEVTSVARWNTSATGYWKIPMYGEAAIGGSSTIFDGIPTVNLMRMLAKVDVANNIAPGGTPVAGNFSLTAVHVVNYNTKGRISPMWDGGGVIGSTPSTSPNLPSVPGTQLWAEGNQMTYTVANNAITNEIYLYESAAMSDNPATPSGLRLVFEGDFTDAGGTAHYYYPVDFTTPAKAYMPVLRNNRYLFTVTGATGRGYDRLAEAVASFGVASNLRTSLLVVDESGITNTVWNGEHFLGTGEPETFEKTSGSKSVPVTTNYTGGWQIDTSKGGGSGITYPGADTGWLTAAKDGAADDQSAPLSLSVASNASERYVNSTTNAAAPRTATVHLKAGRLTQTVTVTQEKYIIAPEFALSNVVLYIDGDGNRILTFAETPAEHTAKTVSYVNKSGGNRTVTFSGATALKANVQGIHFRWGGLVGLSSSCTAKESTALVPTNDVKFWPVEYEEAYFAANNVYPEAVTWVYTTSVQWNDPTQVPYIGDMTIASDAVNHDAFIDRYPGVGYDAAAGYGDICRYMSDMGWVEGNWRLPTQREVYLLDSETKAVVSGGVVYGTFQSAIDWIYVPVDNPLAVGSPYYGFTRIPNARLLGGGITAADASDTDYLTEGGENRVLLPACGNRHFSGGTQYRVGRNGIYWTSTPGSSSTSANADYLWITGNQFNVGLNNSRSYGCAIRCIRVGEDE